MALTPQTTGPGRTGDPAADRAANRTRSAHDDMLVREVDDAVRQERMADAAQRYGLPILIALVVLLAAFAGYLYWQHTREQARERRSEQFVQALDASDRSDWGAAATQLSAMAAVGDLPASARILQAGTAIEQGRNVDAARIFGAIAADDDAPRPYRDLALVRQVALQYDTLKPDEVVAKLKPLAVPGNPWFGSAGELVGMAYLAQGRTDLAGPLFAAIARDAGTPESLQSRARQVAGMLGVDAVDDPEALVRPDGATPAAPTPAPAP